MRMATLLVPFATEPSSPRKIRAGRASADPPPAITFRKAERTPTAKRIRMLLISGKAIG